MIVSLSGSSLTVPPLLKPHRYQPDDIHPARNDEADQTERHDSADHQIAKGRGRGAVPIHLSISGLTVCRDTSPNSLCKMMHFISCMAR